jgi:pentatricopeptide repeat protein
VSQLSLHLDFVHLFAVCSLSDMPFAAHVQNTLIDAYGKLGLWVEALRVLPLMRSKVKHGSSQQRGACADWVC